MELYGKSNLSISEKFPSYRNVSVAKRVFFVAWLALSSLFCAEMSNYR